jgi:peptidoglycan-N-acetylmuramic acid deacetylase
MPNQSHDVPTVPSDAARLLRRYDAHYVGQAGEKVIYLTFDAGYENGITPQILDALRAAGVRASFFLTGTYIEKNGDLVRRMADEGHLVANHTFNHPSMPTLAHDTAALKRELAATERAFREATGRDMAPFLRPPSGEYSARTLCLTQRLGYTTVFWSFAHRDWLVDDQPPVALTLERMVGGSHDGAIYLLHTVSSSNARALPQALARLEAQGYRFALLTELAG